MDKACHEYEAAASKKLVVIATTNLTDTFIDSEKEAIMQLIDGFRTKKTYAQIREGMQKDNLYKSGEGDSFILPDEPKFEEEILSKLATPLDIELKVFDEAGKPYALDEAAHAAQPH